MTRGALVSIHVADAHGGPARSLRSSRLVPDLGLEGDRHAVPRPAGASGRDVTLIEVEALEAVTRDMGIDLGLGDSRRNLVTRGIALNHLVGKTFKVGEVVLRGVRLCEPCAHLEHLTKPGVRSALVHRGGLRADVVEGGTIRVGDAIEVLPDPAA
jgi:MOSC domain-containing protein YiiM